MNPAERRILEELGLPVPKTVADYHKLVARLNALIDKVGDDETHPLAGTLDRMGELIEEFEHQHIHELIENYGFARAVDSPRWKGPENYVRPKEVLKNMRPVDMTPEEREAVEKEAEEVWTWIASLAIAAGIMFLIRYFFLQAFTANRR